MGVVGNAGSSEKIFSGAVLLEGGSCFLLSNGVSNYTLSGINLFSFKNEYECERFCSFLQSELDFKNFMIVFDTSSAQKKYLYVHLHHI